LVIVQNQTKQRKSPYSFGGQAVRTRSDFSINSNQLMHISVFIKNTLKVYLKFLLPVAAFVLSNFSLVFW